MMSAVNKLKTARCFVDGIVSSGSPLMKDLFSFDSPEYAVFPGFCDVHVHFREPGFSYKETMETGSKASARGGYAEPEPGARQQGASAKAAGVDR